MAEGRAPFPLEVPRPGWYEQDAEEWWRSIKTALKEAAARVDKGSIRALGITHQRESFVCTDDEGRPLRQAILWLDARSYREVDRYGSDRFHEITGKPPSMTPALYKLFWLRANEPELLDRTSMVLDVHAFLVHRLTGEWRTSWACADPLGLLDMQSFDWSDEILGEIGLERGQMVELSPPGTVVGELDEDVANETGLPPGLTVVGGAGDGQAAGLGANVTEAGKAYLNLGTALVSGTYSDDYAWGREFRTLAGPIPKTYVPETLLRGGTYTIDWFVDNIGGIKPSDLGLDLSAEQVLETAARQVPPGAEGLLLLPYLNCGVNPILGLAGQGRPVRAAGYAQQGPRLPGGPGGARLRAARRDRGFGEGTRPAGRKVLRHGWRVPQPALLPDDSGYHRPARDGVPGGRDHLPRRRDDGHAPRWMTLPSSGTWPQPCQEREPPTSQSTRARLSTTACTTMSSRSYTPGSRISSPR